MWDLDQRGTKEDTRDADDSNDDTGDEGVKVYKFRRDKGGVMRGHALVAICIVDGLVRRRTPLCEKFRQEVPRDHKAPTPTC